MTDSEDGPQKTPFIDPGDVPVFIILMILSVPFGIPIWLLSFSIRKAARLPFLLICNLLIATEFLVVLLMLDIPHVHALIASLAAGLICAVPPLVFRSRQELAEGYGGEYVAMGHVLSVLLALIGIPRLG